ncbi:hypothetical protein AURDEDRAFT_128752 [Auricularia subglabra TFB-10046 SS5]|nr:hypothetical protein AURDEDRAFT_128752 [Auricularia subglabra TFB-10046 SS5]
MLLTPDGAAQDQVLPDSRPPSSVRVAMSHGWGASPSLAPLDVAWVYDAHPHSSGWDASADGHAAALMLNAAYDHALGLRQTVPRLDARWHRPDQANVRPFGHNDRGDLAPAEVHDVLDDIPRLRSVSDLEKRLLHAWLDLFWLLHSRAPNRCIAAVRRTVIFDDDEADRLCAAMRANALMDFRLLMVAVDPSDEPVYGRTQDGPGISRLYRRFPAFVETAGNPVIDHTTWDEDDGGQSGSSDEESNPPYILSPEQRQAQRIRHAERRIRRVLAIADEAERAASQQEQRMREAVRRRDQGAVVLNVLLRGLGVEPFGEERPGTPS